MQSAVAFLTLFLGLVLGPRPVEVAVAANVNRVEIRLDGALALELSGEPWRGQVDLGASLTPHHLEAVAFDASNVEVGRAELWLNLPRPEAAARLVLLGAGDDPISTEAQLSWSSVASGPPREIRATFDGLDIEHVDTGEISQGRVTFDLPSYDASEFHFLRTELIFSDNLRAEAEMVLGSGHAYYSSSELTALPVRVLQAGAELPDLKRLDGWVEGSLGPVPVVAAEKGLSDAVVVLGRSAHSALRRITGYQSTRLRQGLRKMDDEGRLYVTRPWPVTAGSGAGTTYDLFRFTDGLTKWNGGYLILGDPSRFSGVGAGPGRVADAVAVAGRNATSRGHRRAVVLAVGVEDLDDASRLSAQQVRSYLSDLRVPLLVWCFVDNGDEVESCRRQWPGASPIKTVADFRRAISQLEKELDSQRLLWVEGTHLPQSLKLTALAERVEPVGLE